MAMTPVQARTILEKIRQEAPNELTAAVLQIAMETPDWILKLSKRISIVEKVLAGSIRASQMENGGAAETQPTPAPTPGGARVHADGTPMSAEQAALEDMMDSVAVDKNAGVGGSTRPATAPAQAAAPVVESPVPPPVAQPGRAAASPKA